MAIRDNPDLDPSKNAKFFYDKVLQSWGEGRLAQLIIHPDENKNIPSFYTM